MIIADDTEVKKKDRFQLVTYAVLGTIGLHAAIALYLLVSHLVNDRSRDAEIVAHVIAPPAEEQKTIEKEVVKKQTERLAAAPPMTQVLRSNAAATTAIPRMANVTDTPIGLGQGNLGVGFGRQVSADLGKGAMFFGQKVTGNLGVVFDVSSSMQEYIPIVVQEIQRNFRNATVVCVNSSAMISSSRPPTVVPYKNASLENARVPLLDGNVGQAMDRDLGRLPNCWFIHKDFNTLGEGIEYLINERIKTIFVFSDFHDTHVGSYIERLTIKAQSESAQVNLHVLEPLGSLASSRESYLQNLCTTTKGRYAVGELLNRKR